MRIDTLSALLKLRRIAVEESKRGLAVSIARETEAQARAAEADRRLEEEAEAAMDLAADDNIVEAYARWLPIGRRAADAAQLALEDAISATAHARATLDAARAAEKAALEALEKATEMQEAAADKKNQMALDEAAARQRD